METPTNQNQASGPQRRTRDSFTVFLVVACLALAVLVVLLARENRHLKAQMASPGPEMENALREGDILQPAALTGSAGEPVQVDFGASAGHTLLLVFTSTCPACAETFPIWRDLLNRPHPSVQVVGIQLDREQPGAPAAGHDLSTLPFPVYGPGEPHPTFLEKVPGVPATILVDSGGTVRKVWFGVLGNTQRADLEQEIAPAS